MRFLSKYLLICTTLALAMVGVSSVVAYADEDASAIADDQVVVVSEQSNDVAPDVGIEPEYDRGSGSYAESWRYSQGILTSESDCSAQSMSRSGVLTPGGKKEARGLALTERELAAQRPWASMCLCIKDKSIGAG